MNNNYLKEVKFRDISCKFKILFSSSKVIYVFVFSLLAFFCFYLYSGFQGIFYAITQDYIANYVAPRYILSHPSFTIVMAYPNFIPLLYPFYFIVQWLTNDVHWLNVLVCLCIQIINAFILFRITQILTENKLIPGVFASLFFLGSVIHHDSLLCFAHSRPVMTSFMALLSLYFFAKVIFTKGGYERKLLFLSFLFLLLSVSFGLDFIGLVLFYFLMMLIKIRYFKKDFLYMLFIVSGFFIVLFLARKSLVQVYSLYNTPSFISLYSLGQRIRNFEYSFFSLIAYFFIGIPQAMASLLNDRVSSYYNMYCSLFVLCIPLVFLKKEKILKLYSLWAMIFLLFIPYLFRTGPLAARHFAQIVVASSLFLGLLFHSVFELIHKVKINFLRKTLNLLLLLFLGIFFMEFAMFSRAFAKQFITNNSSFSPFIRKFIEEFKRIEIDNGKKQIYFLKNDIPNKYSFVGSTTYHCYYIFYLAVKYKKLPVDLYPYVFKDLHSVKVEDEYYKNYFISLSDGSCFGFYTDREKLKKALNSRPDIGLQNVVLLNWKDGLKQEKFQEKDY